MSSILLLSSKLFSKQSKESSCTTELEETKANKTNWKTKKNSINLFPSYVAVCCVLNDARTTFHYQDASLNCWDCSSFFYTNFFETFALKQIFSFQSVLKLIVKI